MEEIAHAHSQHLEEQRGTSDNNADTFPDFLALDCVETVDMAPYAETQPGFTPSDELVGRDDVENRLLPPPDMFDDVHYMHSGPDNVHLTDLEEHEVEVNDLAAPASQTRPRSTPRLSTFGTPRSKAGFSNSNSAPKEATVTSAQDSNPYLAMQPVIVDSRGSKKDESHSRLNADLQTLGETISPHFDSELSFRPPRGSASAPVASPENVSPEKCQTPPSGTEVPPVQLRPIPARRRLLENNISSGKSASPRAVKPDVMNTVPMEASSSGQDLVTQHHVTSPRGSVTTSDSRASPSRHSARSGAVIEKGLSSHTSSPSPTLPPSSALSTPDSQQETTPRYNPPPSYSTAMGQRQVHVGSTKSLTTPASSAGTPTITSRTSPPAGISLHRVHASPRSEAKRSSNFREPSPLESASFYRIKETPRDVAGSANAQDRNNCSLGSREASSPDLVSSLYSAVEASQVDMSSFKPRDTPGNSGPYGGHKTPRENMARPSEGREPVTPRDHTNAYGARPTLRSHSSVPGVVRTPRDGAATYGGGGETPRVSMQVQQGLNRNSGSWDSVPKGTDSIASPRNSVRDYVASTPRGSALNGHVAHPSFASASAMSLPNSDATKMHSALSPREPTRQWSQSMDALSPRQQSQAPGGQGLNSTSGSVVAEVHHQPDLHSDVRPFSRPLSRTFDSARLPEQTVTFV